jgi:hypothetical protein
MSVYREKILMAYHELLIMHEELLTRIVNIAMTGEWAEINLIFEAGDKFNFDIDMFRGTNDVNLNKLISFFDELENLMNSLVSTNGITEAEIENDNF